MLTIFITMHLSFVIYTLVGLFLNEPKVARWARNWVKAKFQKKKNVGIRESLNSERTRLTAGVE